MFCDKSIEICASIEVYMFRMDCNGGVTSWFYCSSQDPVTALGDFSWNVIDHELYKLTSWMQDFAVP